MGEYYIDSLIQVPTKHAESIKEAISLVESGKAAYIFVGEAEEDRAPKRSNPQNNLSFLIYTRIAKTLYGNNVIHARCECKLRLGVFILRRDDLRFREIYDKRVRPLDYEAKLEIMEYFPVTSIMNKKQKTEYLKAVINDYTLKGVYLADLDGIEPYITYPEAQNAT